GAALRLLLVPPPAAAAAAALRLRVAVLGCSSRLGRRALRCVGRRRLAGRRVLLRSAHGSTPSAAGGYRRRHILPGYAQTLQPPHGRLDLRPFGDQVDELLRPGGPVATVADGELQTGPSVRRRRGDAP